jgi:hypothetical protein
VSVRINGEWYSTKAAIRVKNMERCYEAVETACLVCKKLGINATSGVIFSAVLEDILRRSKWVSPLKRLKFRARSSR